ncbi:MAG: TolC family protein [Rhizobacter sp.]|nr:TolC family protein [Bacteriovorax sp.]
MMILLLGLITAAHADVSPFFGDLDNFKNKNLNLQTEEQNLKASNDFLLSKRLFWTPKLNFSLDKNRTRINNSDVTDYDSITGDLTLNLFKGGSDWNKMKGAKAQNNAQELQVLNENLRVEVKASDLIFKSLYITETQRIEEQLLKLKEESYKIVKDRYSQGKIPLQEVTKSEVDLVQQKNKLRTAVLELSENRSQISSLFINVIQTKSWPFNEKTMPKLTETSKLPAIEQKFWISQSREQTWRATKGLHWPSLDLHLQYQESPIKERTSKQLVGVVSLSFPIWNQYETSASVSSAYADYIGSLNDYKDTDQTLQQRTLFLKEKIETARLNLYESKRNLDLSKKLYEDILKSFRLGRISTNDLIIEQNRLLESENNLALSQLTFHQGIIEACTLSGIKTSDCLQ